MKLTLAWGWLTAGVLALGLNGIYQDGGAVWAHRALDQVAAGVAERIEPALALGANWFTAGIDSRSAWQEMASCRLATELGSLQRSFSGFDAARQTTRQVEIDGFEVMSAQEAAALASLEMNRARIEASLQKLRVEPVASQVMDCPRIRISVPRIRVIAPTIRFRD